MLGSSEAVAPVFLWGAPSFTQQRCGLNESHMYPATVDLKWSVLPVGDLWPRQALLWAGLSSGHSGLLPHTTWVCTLDLLCILQHVHIYTAHVSQLTGTQHRPLYTLLMAATSSRDLFLSLHTAAYKHLPAASRSHIPYMCACDLWTYRSY